MSAHPLAAGLWRRVAAAAYDMLLLIGILMLTSFFIVIARHGMAVPAGHPAYQLFLLAQAAAFFIVFWSHGGQTLGMRAWHIRVERSDGNDLDAVLAAKRFALATLSALALGMGFLWMLIDREHLAWHDRLTGTRVVKTRG
jgi:uncharacterized RDD family membrane protein YckC